MDKYGYIGIETLLNFCENSKDHAVTPNDFMRMKRADVTERKTGKWIRETKHYKDSEQEFYYCEKRCSECGTKRKIGWAVIRYCPMCGARMVQEGEDNDG